MAEELSNSGLSGLEGKSAVVTGASRGIGLTTAVALAAHGANVVAVSRTGKPPSLTAVAGGDRLHFMAADVSDRTAMDFVAKEAARSTGRIDICVANAGVALVEDFLETSLHDWRAVLDVNLLGAMNTFQSALRHMMADRKGGRLLVNSSAAGLRGEANTQAYSASKAALHGLVQSLAVELAPVNITVNAVAPGEIETELQSDALRVIAERNGTSLEEERERLMRDRIPMGRLGQPSEVAALFVFLCSTQASYITGQIIAIDGGELLN
jgi:3-oxoacyl-[acyl-carrier protein] reductase